MIAFVSGASVVTVGPPRARPRSRRDRGSVLASHMRFTAVPLATRLQCLWRRWRKGVDHGDARLGGDAALSIATAEAISTRRTHVTTLRSERDSRIAEGRSDQQARVERRGGSGAVHGCRTRGFVARLRRHLVDVVSRSEARAAVLWLATSAAGFPVAVERLHRLSCLESRHRGRACRAFPAPSAPRAQQWPRCPLPEWSPVSGGRSSGSGRPAQCDRHQRCTTPRAADGPSGGGTSGYANRSRVRAPAVAASALRQTTV
jgi:hypothetical protein